MVVARRGYPLVRLIGRCAGSQSPESQKAPVPNGTASLNGQALTFAIKTQDRTETPSGAMKRDSATPASVPVFLEPMKAKLVNSIPPGDWIYEVKFDGYRALALRRGAETRLLSRNQKDLDKKFP